MSRAAELKSWAEQEGIELLFAEGFDEALIGIFERCGRPPVAAYSRQRCIEILVQRDGMTGEQAEEFFAFNVEGAWVGEGTPAFLWWPMRVVTYKVTLT